jgi:putative membrane protein
MSFEYLKALHLIFMVTWFAGLFYIVRLFVYQRENLDRIPEEQKIIGPQLALMARRLWYGITWPSAILILVFGIWMLVDRPGYLKAGWMHLKLALVFGLLLYHLFCQRLFSALQKGRAIWTSMQLRLWNEVATIFLVAIVFLVVLKSSIDMFYGLGGLVLFSLFLLVAIRVYKATRNMN